MRGKPTDLVVKPEDESTLAGARRGYKRYREQIYATAGYRPPAWLMLDEVDQLFWLGLARTVRDVADYTLQHAEYTLQHAGEIIDKRVVVVLVDPTELQLGDVVVGLSEHDISGCHCDVRVTVIRARKDSL